MSISGASIGVSPQSVHEADFGYREFGAPSVTGSEPRIVADIPTYDPTDESPLSPLIKHLVETFFVHLGCNFPFLQRDSFTKAVQDRQVEAILVDAVCGLAARFSDHPLLSTSNNPRHSKADYGLIFAQRAISAVTNTFPCPTVAATQACLLLAYESFGADQDSALWMYLGCAIRMAVDLGLQKLDGVKGLESTPPPANSTATSSKEKPNKQYSAPKQVNAEIADRGVVEKERTDTLWAVFMLDRVISSGTGRPVTLKDEDFELCFPEVTSSAKTGWPDPFPALIQIIHLYGRVSDLLNNIRDVKDLTESKMQGLGVMENDLTKFYQKLDPRLAFNAANFQHYVKSGEGTNFILVHFWFHTLIMLVHQPMLLHSFEGRIQQLLPNSRELSMSSAKTIADILAFAELIDPKSFIGNPFTSQPIYIAACAFLMESAAHTSLPNSRTATPPRSSSQKKSSKKNENDAGQSAKHTLLASAANQNYQRCYRALQQLQTYWGGTKYILTALDQKAKGIWDPETYTTEEMESTKAARSDVSTELRRKLRTTFTAKSPGIRGMGIGNLDFESAVADPSQAIGWSLTGTTNSPSSNLAFLYQSLNGPEPQPSTPSSLPGNMIYDPIRQSLPEVSQPAMSTSAPHSNTIPYPGSDGVIPRPDYLSRQQRQSYSSQMPPPIAPTPQTSTSVSDADLLLGLQQHPSPFSHPLSHQPYARSPSVLDNNSTLQATNHASHPPHQHQQQQQQQQLNPQTQTSPSSVYKYPLNDMSLNSYDFAQNGHGSNGELGGVGDMMIQSQDIDISVMGNEFSPWLEYLPHDVMGWNDAQGGMGGE